MACHGHDLRPGLDRRSSSCHPWSHSQPWHDSDSEGLLQGVLGDSEGWRPRSRYFRVCTVTATSSSHARLARSGPVGLRLTGKSESAGESRPGPKTPARTHDLNLELENSNIQYEMSSWIGLGRDRVEQKERCNWSNRLLTKTHLCFYPALRS
jgi:hypothetical protein